MNAIHALSQLSYGPCSEWEARRQTQRFRRLPIQAPGLGPATFRFKRNATQGGEPDELSATVRNLSLLAWRADDARHVGFTFLFFLEESVVVAGSRNLGRVVAKVDVLLVLLSRDVGS